MIIASDPDAKHPTDAAVIHLTYDEVCLGCFHGLMRRMAKFRGERGDRAQSAPSTWQNEMEGSCAELAYNKLRGTYPTGIAGLRASDAGRDEVRWTLHDSLGGLIIYRNDDPEKRYVLMVGFAPDYRIVGWLPGIAGKRNQWADPRGYFLVPRTELRPASEL